MAKRLIPLLDRVLVEKLKPMNKSIGGVLLPDTATHRVSFLTIVQQHVYNDHTAMRSQANSSSENNTLRSSRPA